MLPPACQYWVQAVLPNSYFKKKKDEEDDAASSDGTEVTFPLHDHGYDPDHMYTVQLPQINPHSALVLSNSVRRMSWTISHPTRSKSDSSVRSCLACRPIVLVVCFVNQGSGTPCLGLSAEVRGIVTHIRLTLRSSSCHMKRSNRKSDRMGGFQKMMCSQYNLPLHSRSCHKTRSSRSRIQQTGKCASLPRE